MDDSLKTNLQSNLDTIQSLLASLDSKLWNHLELLPDSSVPKATCDLINNCKLSIAEGHLLLLEAEKQLHKILAIHNGKAMPDKYNPALISSKKYISCIKGIYRVRIPSPSGQRITRTCSSSSEALLVRNQLLLETWAPNVQSIGLGMSIESPQLECKEDEDDRVEFTESKAMLFADSPTNDIDLWSLI